MGQITDGLPDGGTTVHFQISYEGAYGESIGAPIATVLCENAEGDLSTIQGWFPGVTYQWDYPIIVYVNLDGGNDASWNGPDASDRIFGGNTYVQVNVNVDVLPTTLRFLLAAEVTEMFMASQNAGWWYGEDYFHEGDEGSKGEALSGFLAYRLAVLAGADGSTLPLTNRVQTWLNSARPDYVDDNPDNMKDATITGCGTCFLEYLFYERGFSEVQIVQAGDDKLSGVYNNLTGQNDAWQSFINACNQYYPPIPYQLQSGQIFPGAQLLSLDDIELSSSQVAFVVLTLNSPAPADISISFSADDEWVLVYPSSKRFTPGSSTLLFTITAAPIAGAGVTTRLHANYAGQTVSAYVSVTPPATLSGTVTDENNVPIADATVLISSPIQILPPGGNTLQLSTDANGFYQTPVLPIATYTVNASQSGYYQSADQSAEIGFGRPSAEINFVLVATEPYIVQGQVTSDNGLSIAGARVQLNASSPVPNSITTTDGAGYYYLTAEPDPFTDSYTCLVVAAGFADRSLPLTIANGAVLTQNIVLDRLGAASGIVSGSQSRPISFAQIRANGQSAWSDANGHYTLTGLDPGPNTITVSAAGYDTLAEVVPVAPGATAAQNFTLTAATAAIQGTINSNEDGEPIQGAAITTGLQRAVSDANGFYQLPHVAAGSVSLFVAARSYVAQRKTVAIDEGETVTADFTLGGLHPRNPFPQ